MSAGSRAGVARPVVVLLAIGLVAAFVGARWLGADDGYSESGYIGAGITHGWLPTDPSELVRQSSGAGGGDMQVFWTADYRRDMVTRDSDEQVDDIELGPGRDAWLGVQHTEDYTQIEIVEPIDGAGVVLVSRWLDVSRADAIRGARELSWDAERAWRGDTALGADMAATYLPDGVDRVVVAPGDAAHAVDITNAAGTQSVRITRLHAGDAPPAGAASRAFDTIDGVTYVTASTTGLPDGTDQAVLEGLRVGCCWNAGAGPDVFGTVIGSGTTGDTEVTLMIGEDTPGAASSVGLECLLVAVGSETRSICPEQQPDSGPWLTTVDGVAVTLDRDPTEFDGELLGDEADGHRESIVSTASGWSLRVLDDAGADVGVAVPVLDVLRLVETAHPGVGAIRWADRSHDAIVIAPVHPFFPERTIPLTDLP